MSESALIFAIPEAEPVVAHWRARHDSSAAVGVPAHVTLIYPFLDPDAIDASEVAAMTALFASARPIDVVFRRTARFEPSVLYLAPEPEAPLLDLMRRVWDRWPQCPPYGGTIPRDSVRPHLTVSDSETGERLDRIDLAVGGGLPVASRLHEASLIENRTGTWTTRERFGLG